MFHLFSVKVIPLIIIELGISANQIYEFYTKHTHNRRIAVKTTYIFLGYRFTRSKLIGRKEKDLAKLAWGYVIRTHRLQSDPVTWYMVIIILIFIVPKNSFEANKNLTLKVVSPKFVWPEIFSDPEFFRLEIVFDPKFVGIKFCRPKILSDHDSFQKQKHFRPKLRNFDIKLCLKN